MYKLRYNTCMEHLVHLCYSSNCFSSIFLFGQITKFKRGIIQEKKLNQNSLSICTSRHYILHYYIVSRNFVEQFQRSCADKLFKKYL